MCIRTGFKSIFFRYDSRTAWFVNKIAKFKLLRSNSIEEFIAKVTQTAENQIREKLEKHDIRGTF